METCKSMPFVCGDPDCEDCGYQKRSVESGDTRGVVERAPLTLATIRGILEKMKVRDVETRAIMPGYIPVMSKNSERFRNGLISGGMCLTDREALALGAFLLFLWVLFG